VSFVEPKDVRFGVAVSGHSSQVGARVSCAGAAGEQAVKYLQLAVNNTVRAEHLQAEDDSSHEPTADKREGHDPDRTSTHATLDRA
jgi:hypothetical protein